LFRGQIARGTALGVEAQTYIAQGHLVPDRVTNAMVRERLAVADAAGGFILDGYPRNVPQVAVLDQILDQLGWKLDAVLELQLPEDLVVERLLGRAVAECRTDDSAPVIRERLAVYHRETEPIAQIYRERGILLPVDGLGTVEEVAAKVRHVLGGI
jgi:adenylate kinase